MLKSHTGETGRIVISSNNILLIILRGQPGDPEQSAWPTAHTRTKSPSWVGCGGGGTVELTDRRQEGSGEGEALNLLLRSNAPFP